MITIEYLGFPGRNLSESPFAFLDLAFVSFFGDLYAVSDASGTAFTVTTDSGRTVTRIEGSGFVYGPDGYPTAGQIETITLRDTQRDEVTVVLSDIDEDAGLVFDAVRLFPTEGFAAINALLGSDGITYSSRSSSGEVSFAGITGDVVYVSDGLPGSFYREVVIAGPGDDSFVLTPSPGAHFFGIGDGQDTVSFDPGRDYSNTFEIALDESATDNGLRAFIDLGAGTARFLQDGGTTDFVGFVTNDAGNFTIGNFVLNGGAGDDVFVLDLGDPGNVRLVEFRGSAGDDVLRITGETNIRLNYDTEGATGVVLRVDRGLVLDDGFGGRDRIFIDASAGVQIAGSAGDDTLVGGAGDDIFYAYGRSAASSGGDDLIDGGDGYDVLLTQSFGGLFTNSSSRPVFIDLARNEMRTIRGDSFDTNRIYNFEEIRTGRGDDTLFGDSGDNIFSAGDGDDIARGGGGDDVLGLGDGDNRGFGGAGNDSIGGSGIMRGGFGDDSIRVEGSGFGDAGNDTIIGSRSQDVLRGGFGDDSITSGDGGDLVFGEGGNDTLIGGSRADTISGGSGRDSLEGFAGDDILTGGAGFDTLVGGDGDDSLSGGGGNDVLSGGSGVNTLDGGSGDDILMGGNESEGLTGGGGNDTLIGNVGEDTLDGGVGADLLDGGGSNDFMAGDVGRDTLLGGSGFDTLLGGANADVLDGGEGDDVLLGGTGNDTLTGGSGADVFIFGGGFDRDTVTDFEIANDTLQVNDVFTGGETDAQLVVDTYARIAPDGTGQTSVILDFGNGNIITLEGIASLDGLADAITIV